MQALLLITHLSVLILCVVIWCFKLVISCYLQLLITTPVETQQEVNISWLFSTLLKKLLDHINK